jgi:hypothetical protein
MIPSIIAGMENDACGLILFRGKSGKASVKEKESDRKISTKQSTRNEISSKI